jgi:hypothetical protein
MLPPSSGRWLIALMMEAASTPETSINLYQTTLRNNPEVIHLGQNIQFWKDRLY